MKPLLVVALLSLFPLPQRGQPPEAPAYRTSRLVLPDVTLRDGVTVDLSLTVFSNTERACNGRTVLAVHGMLHTAGAWEPFAASLFGSGPRGLAPCRILALDLPGHGHSGQPTGALFGELTLDDYLSSVLGGLDRLHELHIYPDALVGHSLGGALLVLAQQRLKGADTNLLHAHRVHDVLTLGGAVLNPIPQAQWDSGAALAPIFAFAQESATMGRYVAVPVSFWRAFMFANLAATTPPTFAEGAPSVADIIGYGYFGPVGSPVAFESRTMLEGMVPRPAVDAGLFDPAEGTRLTVVAYEQDRVVQPAKARDFYTYLTRDASGEDFILIGGLNAVHDTHIANPALLLAGIGRRPWR